MKRKVLTLIFLLSTTAISSFGQGTVNFANTSTTLVQTNLAIFGGSVGNTTPVVGDYFYALLTAPSTVTSLSRDAQELLTSTWTFTGLYGTNSAGTGGGRLSGGSGVAAMQGWLPGATNSFVVVGWSANFGTTWPQIAAAFSGANFVGNATTGGWNFTSAGPGYFGISPVGQAEAGGGTAGFPSAILFGPPGTAVNPISSGFDLYIATDIPEPGSLALIFIGVGAWVARSRLRKKARDSVFS